MSFKSATNQVQLKQFKEILEAIPAPKKIKPSSINAEFGEYFDYLFSVAQKLNSFFKDESFVKALEDAGVKPWIVDNLKFWSTMVSKTPDVAAKEIYYGDQPLSYIRELASVNGPERAIGYLEQVLDITSKTKNPAELVASICDVMARKIYKDSGEAKKVLSEHLNEKGPEKKSFFGIFKGHEK